VSTRGFLIAALLALGVMPVAARSAAAQTVRGRVIDGRSGAPIVGAIVSLVAGDSVRRSPVLTDANGRFALRGESSGRFGLRVDRVGFASEVVASDLVLTVGAEVTGEWRVGGVAVSMAAIRVTDGAACARLSDGGADVARVWEQLRTALTATQVTSDQQLVPLELVLEDEIRRGPEASRGASVPPATRRAQVWRTRASRPFVSGVMAGGGVSGFRVRDGDTTRFYGPDAHAVLDPAFAAAHCFRLVRGGAFGRRSVGLRFTPVDSSSATWLDGVVWANASTSMLERVEWRFVVPGWPKTVEAPRGEVAFTELANGRWFVSSWGMRIPMLGRDPRDGANGPRWHAATRVRSGRARVLRDGGAGVAATAVVTGTVRDSVTGLPLGNALVLVNGVVAAVTDARGAFTVRDDSVSAAGVTRVFSAAHLSLPRYGVPMPDYAVTLSPGDSLAVELSSAGPLTVLAARCPGVDAGRGLGAIVGVVDLAGHDWRAVVLEARWSSGSGADARRAVELSPDGAFVLCEVPVERRVELRVEWPDGSARTAGVLAAGGVVRVYDRR
jgi:hypothetical protein